MANFVNVPRVEVVLDAIRGVMAEIADTPAFWPVAGEAGSPWARARRAEARVGLIEARVDQAIGAWVTGPEDGAIIMAKGSDDPEVRGSAYPGGDLFEGLSTAMRRMAGLLLRVWADAVHPNGPGRTAPSSSPLVPAVRRQGYRGRALCGAAQTVAGRLDPSGVYDPDLAQLLTELVGELVLLEKQDEQYLGIAEEVAGWAAAQGFEEPWIALRDIRRA